ncbi:hypothetical protein GCM10027413_25280 [Conyzicola nivalis]|uniref:Di-and tripeptidase n=1 Tax=Conyzicola nivalis TaxID=1477021 RepID=A0A916WDB2_9MICO|nr:hypothetical protein [Conyzicola nivalis]GGA90369.1 hypothetical protein GCM10010979_01330 [Conyzicola nivalis]
MIKPVIPAATPQIPEANRFVVGGIDRLLTVQRPAVLAHLHSIRAHNPDATPEQVIRILERRYLTAVTTGGALVGASAVIPAVGIGASLALSTVETGGFLEASALFAQSVTEVHGIAVDDPDRARTLVMTLILGSAGSDLVKQLAGQASGNGPVRNKFWGEMVTKSLPQAAMGQIADRLKRTFLKRFALTQGTNVVGRAIPFGIGAVVGGAGNNLLGRQVVRSAREAFRAAPPEFPAVLALRVKAPKQPKPAKEQRLPKRLRGEKQPRMSRTQRALEKAQRDFPVDPSA